MEPFEMAGLVLILSIFLICVLTIVMRWFRHRERLAMIDRGLVPAGTGASAHTGQRNGRALRRWGLGIAILGLLLLCAAFWVAVPALTPPFAVPGGLPSLGLVHLPGLLVVFMGVGLLILYVLAQPTLDGRTPAPAPSVPAPGAPTSGGAQEVVQDAELEGFGPFEDTSGSAQEFKAPADD